MYKNKYRNSKNICELCNDTGYVPFENPEGRALIPCGCQNRLSYRENIKSPKFTYKKCRNCFGKGYVRDTTEIYKECNGKGEIPKSTRQNFYDEISSFIEYPSIFLTELANVF